MELVGTSASIEASSKMARLVIVLPPELAVAVRMMSVPNWREEFVDEALRVTEGPLTPIIPISGEVVFNPVLSVARAKTKFVPGAGLVRTMVNGAVVVEPREFVLEELVRTKNST